MRLHIFLLGITAALGIAILSGCSVKFEAGYHGQTGRDDRVISPVLYPEGVTQMRETKARY